MLTRACADINLAALRHNLQQVKKTAPKSRIMAMVKANAYGHGLLPIARALSDADALGVATVQEALQLRQQNITQSIAVMGGFQDGAELQQLLDQRVQAVIHSEHQLALLKALPQPTQTLQVWLKIDTGMHRLGFAPEQAADIYAQLQACSWVEKPIGFMTHFACSDLVEHPLTAEQIALFRKTVIWPGEQNLACSAAIIVRPQAHGDWVRPGIMLYGVSPFTHQIGAEFNLQPVMTLRSRIIAIKTVCQGESIGYGAMWVCPHDMRVGVVSIGYGDGYPRSAQNGTPVLVNGQRCSLVGRVSMDLITVDLTEQPQAAVNDPVVLWGEGLPAEQVAHCAGTIGYELLTKVTPRVEFKVV